MPVYGKKRDSLWRPTSKGDKLTLPKTPNSEEIGTSKGNYKEITNKESATT